MREALEDPDLGLLAWDDDAWRGEPEVRPGQRVELTVADEEGASAEDVLRKARQVWSRVRREEAGFRRLTAEQLADLYNRSWRQGEPLDVAGIVARIQLVSVIVYFDGTLALWYDDGDLFAGHTIDLWLWPDGRVKAGLVG